MLALGLLLCRLTGPDLAEHVAFGLSDLLQGALWGILLLALVVVLVDHPKSPFAGLQQDMEQLRLLFREAKAMDFVFISIMAGIGEEVLFRGYLLHHGVAWFGAPVGLILSSLLFGLVHAISFAYVLFATALGLALGMLYLWSGNLVVPIVAHGVYDVVALFYLVRLRRELPRPPS